MAANRAFTDAEAVEVVRLHEDGIDSTQIARKFGTARSTVLSIVTGRSYRNVTGCPPDQRCGTCLLCKIENRQEVNFNAARAATSVFHCVGCQKPLRLPVATALREHGETRCTSCGGRHK